MNDLKEFLCDPDRLPFKVMDLLAGRAGECGCCLAYRMLGIGLAWGTLVGVVATLVVG